MSSLAIHLSIVRNYVAITYRLYFLSYIFKKSYRAFVRCFYYEVRPIFLVVIWCGMCKFVWPYGISVFFFYTFFSKLICFYIALNVSMYSYFIYNCKFLFLLLLLLLLLFFVIMHLFFRIWFCLCSYYEVWSV